MKKYLIIFLTIVVGMLVNTDSCYPVYARQVEYELVICDSAPPVIECQTIKKKVTLPDEEVQLMAKVIIAEAGNQTDYGKRLVIDSILNRVDSERFPDSVVDVLYQENQFSVVESNAIDLYTPTDDICEMIDEELNERTNEEVIFFRTKKFSTSGKPLFVVGDHYFSSLR